MDKSKTYILVWNDLHTDDMPSGLKDLAQNILGDPWIQSSHIKRPLVGFRGGTTDLTKSTSARRGKNTPSSHGGADSRRDRIVVLGDDDGCQRRRGHVSLAIALSAIKAWRTGRSASS